MHALHALRGSEQIVVPDSQRAWGGFKRRNNPEMYTGQSHQQTQQSGLKVLDVFGQLVAPQPRMQMRVASFESMQTRFYATTIRCSVQGSRKIIELGPASVQWTGITPSARFAVRVERQSVSTSYLCCLPIAIY